MWTGEQYEHEHIIKYFKNKINVRWEIATPTVNTKSESGFQGKWDSHPIP